jgi:predicted amidohydrolase
MAAPATLQVSCVQLHWATEIERNLERTLYFIEEAKRAGSRVVLFPEATLTSYYFPYVVELPQDRVQAALDRVCRAAKEHGLWVIAGTIRKTRDRFLNLAHVIDSDGAIVHEYAKVNMAGRDEKKYCRGGDKLSLFEIDGIMCTLVICRDGFHCVANTVGQSPDGKQTSSGASFIREPNGIPLAEAGYYQEEMITAVLDLSRADRSYVLDSMQNPPFLRQHWSAIVKVVTARKDVMPE